MQYTLYSVQCKLHLTLAYTNNVANPCKFSSWIDFFVTFIFAKNKCTITIFPYMSFYIRFFSLLTIQTFTTGLIDIRIRKNVCIFYWLNFFESEDQNKQRQRRQRKRRRTASHSKITHIHEWIDWCIMYMYTWEHLWWPSSSPPAWWWPTPACRSPPSSSTLTTEPNQVSPSSWGSTIEEDTDRSEGKGRRCCLGGQN